MVQGDFLSVRLQTMKTDLSGIVTQHQSRIIGGTKNNMALFTKNLSEEIIFHFQAIGEQISINLCVPLFGIMLSSHSDEAEHLHAVRYIRALTTDRRFPVAEVRVRAVPTRQWGRERSA